MWDDILKFAGKVKQRLIDEEDMESSVSIKKVLILQLEYMNKRRGEFRTRYYMMKDKITTPVRMDSLEEWDDVDKFSANALSDHLDEIVEKCSTSLDK